MSNLCFAQMWTNMTNFIFRPHLSHIYLISNLFFHPVMQKMNVRFVGQAINRIYAVLLVNSFYKVIIENVFTFKISVLLKMAQMRLFSRREVKQVWERAFDIRLLRLATRLIKLGISNQGALRWHLNENRDFFLLGSLNYLLSLNRQFEQPSKYVLFM